MKTLFDAETRNNLIQRIDALRPDSKANWGQMNPYQMLKHCTLSEEMFFGKKTYKRLFIGLLFGKIALKGILKTDNPIGKNKPTHPELSIVGSGDFYKEREKWIQLLKGYSRFANPNFVHPFFGKMTTAQIGVYVYKHTDHHLRQFGI